MFLLFSKHSSITSRSSSKSSSPSLKPSRETAKPFAGLKKKVKLLFRNEKVSTSNIQFEVVLGRDNVKEHSVALQGQGLKRPIIDDEVFEAMKAMFDALHHPSVLDARRHSRFGLVSSAVAMDIDITSQPKLIEGHPRASALDEGIINPTCHIPVKAPEAPVFYAPLKAISGYLDVCLERSWITLPRDPIRLTSPTRYLELRVVRCIGAGSSGRVFEVEEQQSKMGCVLKIVKKNNLTERKITDLMAERDIHDKLQDSIWFSHVWGSWHDEANFYFGMATYATSIFTEIVFLERLDIERTLFYISEMIIAVTELHARGILHGDIKAENILIDHRGHIVLADFGLSTDFNKIPRTRERTCQPYYPYHLSDKVGPDTPHRDPSELPFVITRYRGSPFGMAPEIHSRKPYSFCVDWWSVGVLGYFMATGRLPWHTRDSGVTKSLEQMICEEPVRWNEEDSVSDDFKDFIEQMLEKNPVDRINPLDMPLHPYFAEVDWNLMEDQQVPPPWVPSATLAYQHWEGVTIPSPGKNISSPEEDTHPGFSFLSELGLRTFYKSFREIEEKMIAAARSPSPSVPIANIFPKSTTETPQLDNATVSVSNEELSVKWERTLINEPSRQPHGPGKPEALSEQSGSWHTANEVEDEDKPLELEDKPLPTIPAIPSSPPPAPDRDSEFSGSAGNPETDQIQHDDAIDNSTGSIVGLWPTFKSLFMKIKLPNIRGWRISLY